MYDKTKKLTVFQGFTLYVFDFIESYLFYEPDLIFIVSSLIELFIAVK